jgi:hypothetical protein
MDVNFNIDINLQDWAKAIGYKIVGDKLVKEYKLTDFEEAVKQYIEAMLDAGWNSNVIEENFFVNDTDEFKSDFEYEYETIKEE